MKNTFFLSLIAIGVLTSCSSTDEETYIDIDTTYPAIQAEFGSSIDLNNLEN